MILNYEGDNTLEGKYILAKEVQNNDSILKIDFPTDFYLNRSQKRHQGNIRLP